MIGRGVLLECLDHLDISEVLIVNRKSAEQTHQKLKELVIEDFFNIQENAEELTGYDACLFCLGTSAVGKSEAEYRRITYDLTLLFAQTVLQQNPGMTFCYVSGAGTDGSEKGRMMWARVKGKTENDLSKMDFGKAYAFRPGFIQPLRGIKSATGWYNIAYGILGFLYPLLKNLNSVTDTTIMGRSMINVARDGYEKSVLESVDINETGGR